MTEVHLITQVAPENVSSTDLAAYLPPPWVAWAAAGIIAAVTAAALIRRARRASDRKPASVEDHLTRIVAGIATAVSAQGMWRFTGDILHLDGPLRVLLFAFIELAIVVSAIRARRNMRENYSAGIDGLAVWALAALTAVLSTLDAKTFGEAIFRLAAPMVAAWLWERGMAIERRRLRGSSSINWRLTPERFLVWVGLAEASDRTAGDVDAQRRINRVADAVMKVRDLADARPRQQARARRKLRAALSKAVEHAQLATDPERQTVMLDQIGALCSSDTLATMRSVAPWASLDHPAVQPTAAEEAMATLARWEYTEARQRASLHAAAKVWGLTGVTPDVTGYAIADRVTDRVANGVTNQPSLTVVDTPLDVTPSVTDPAIANDVTEEVADPADEAAKTQRMRAFWESEVAEDRYPKVKELADHVGAHHSLASRLRQQWVKELPWQKRAKADPRRTA